MPKTFKIPKELVDQMEVIAQKSDQEPAMPSPESQVPPVEPEDQFTEPANEVPAVPIEAEPALDAATPAQAPEPEAPVPATPLAQSAEPVVAAPPEVVEVAPPVAPPVAPERKPRKPKNELSESDLADWTSRITAMQQERDQARREVAERRAKKKEQAAAWRTLRRLVEEASQKVDPAVGDDLAQRVHLAPKKLRDAIEAVLTAHGY